MTLTRDIALIFLAGITVVCVVVAITILAVAKAIPLAVAGTVLAGALAVANGAIGRLTGVGADPTVEK